MAVYVQKVWNNVPCIVTEGVAVDFSKNGSTLYVLNETRHRMAMFKTVQVARYWVEEGPATLLPVAFGESNQTIPF